MPLKKDLVDAVVENKSRVLKNWLVGVGVSQARLGFERPEPSLRWIFEAWAWPIAYQRLFILARPGLFKSLAWPDSLFKSLLHNKYLIFLWKSIKIISNIKGHITHTWIVITFLLNYRNKSYEARWRFFWTSYNFDLHN